MRRGIVVDMDGRRITVVTPSGQVENLPSHRWQHPPRLGQEILLPERPGLRATVAAGLSRLGQLPGRGRPARRPRFRLPALVLPRPAVSLPAPRHILGWLAQRRAPAVLASVLAATAVVAVGLTLPAVWNPPVATVGLEINPRLELAVTADARVAAVRALDPAGSAVRDLARSRTPAWPRGWWDWRSRPELASAVTDLVTAARDLGYLSDGGAVVAAVVPLRAAVDPGLMWEAVQEAVTRLVATETGTILVAVRATPETLGAAREAGMSIGLYLMSRAAEIAGAPRPAEPGAGLGRWVGAIGGPKRAAVLQAALEQVTEVVVVEVRSTGRDVDSQPSSVTGADTDTPAPPPAEREPRRRPREPQPGRGPVPQP